MNFEKELENYDKMNINENQKNEFFQVNDTFFKVNLDLSDSLLIKSFNKTQTTFLSIPIRSSKSKT